MITTEHFCFNFTAVILAVSQHWSSWLAVSRKWVSKRMLTSLTHAVTGCSDMEWYFQIMENRWIQVLTCSEQCFNARVLLPSLSSTNTLNSNQIYCFFRATSSKREMNCKEQMHLPIYEVSKWSIPPMLAFLYNWSPGSCKYGNELSGSIKCGRFLDKLRTG